MKEELLRRELVNIAHRMYERGFVCGSAGNISVKLDDENILITPSGSSLGDLKDDEPLICDADGILKSERRITSESPMHLEVYRQRMDVRAVIHAHPPYVVALSLAGASIDDDLLPEVIMTLGKVPTASFAVPSSTESAKVVFPLLQDHNAIILDRHGSLTVGGSLEQAWRRLELLESAAKIIYLARTLGDVKRLTKDEIKRIKESAERYGKH